MTLKAWIVDGVVRDVSADPDASFHPTVAALYTTTVPDGTRSGAVQISNVWTNPEPAPEPAPTEDDIVVDVPTFFMLFTVGEEAAIRASDNVLVKTLLGRLDDPRTLRVNLSLPPVQQGIGALVSLGLLDSGRAVDVLAGHYPT